MQPRSVLDIIQDGYPRHYGFNQAGLKISTDINTRTTMRLPPL